MSAGGGPVGYPQLKAMGSVTGSEYRLSVAERKARGMGMEGYWGRQSTNTRDRATAMMPRMLYDRLDELGIDFGIVYPTAGLGIPLHDTTRNVRSIRPTFRNLAILSSGIQP